MFIEVIDSDLASLFIDNPELPRSLRALSRVDSEGDFGLWVEFEYDGEGPDPNAGLNGWYFWVEDVPTSDLLAHFVRANVGSDDIEAGIGRE